MSTSRGVNYVDGLLFAAGEWRPRIVKIPYVAEQDIEWPFSDVPSHNLDCSSWFDGGRSMLEAEIKKHGVKGQSLGPTLLVMHANTFMHPVSTILNPPANRCVEVATEGQCRDWRGNIVVVRAVEPTSTITQFCDAKMGDVGPVVAWLKEMRH